MLKAAIVILNYNGRNILQRFLPGVIENSHYDIFLADNASTDDSVAYLKKKHPQIHCIFLPENSGYSGGYNAALERLKGRYEYYVLLNSDIEVTPGWDKDMVSWLDQNPAIAAAQPKILSFQKRNNFDYAGAAGGFLDALGYPYCRGRILHTIEEDQGQYDDIIPVDWGSGACFFIRARVFHEFKGFESGFFAHMEEIELCWRLRNAGKAIYCNGEVKVYHLGGGTLSKTDPYKTYLNFRNSLWMLYKNLKTFPFIKIFAFRLLWDSGAVMHLLFTQGYRHSIAVIKAYCKFLLKLSRIEKSPILASKLKSVLGQKQVFSIIFTYYLKGGKKFSGRMSIK